MKEESRMKRVFGVGGAGVEVGGTATVRTMRKAEVEATKESRALLHSVRSWWVRGEVMLLLVVLQVGGMWRGRAIGVLETSPRPR